MLEKLCVGLVRILLGAVLLFMTVLSALVTCRVYGGAEIVQYAWDLPVFHIVFCVGIVVLPAIIKLKKEKKILPGQETEQRIKKYPAQVTNLEKIRALMQSNKFWIILAVVIYILWIFLVPSWGGADSRLCMKAASGFLQGDFSAWEPVPFTYGTPGCTGYAYTYPSQNGLILYVALLSFFFGDAAHVLFQVLNILFFVLGVVSLHNVEVEEERKKDSGLLLWMLFCLPFSFYILFAYGTVPGFGLSCFAMHHLMRYVKEDRGKDFWIGAFAAAAAVLFKSNYLIVMFALFLYLAASGVFKKKISIFIASLLLVLVYVVASRGVKFGISSVTGYEVSGGAPMIAWVEMGLQESSRAPGWYNGYQVNLFEQADGDSELVSEWVREDLKNTLSEMALKPKETAKFFLKKVASIWAEPTFQSLWIQEVGNSSWSETSLPWQLFKEEGILNKIYVFAANLMQTFVYAMSFFWVAVGMSDRKLHIEKESRWDMLLPGIVFIGGSIFHIFWEAKGQYTVVYFMLLLPYAYKGLIYAGKHCLVSVVGR